VSRPVIGAVTIGQAPRPDLLEPLVTRAGTHVEIVEVGALDGTSPGELAVAAGRTGREAGSYPLTTRLRDGSLVTLDESDLAPLVQGAIDLGEGRGAAVTLLLCAGGFATARARGTLVRPFDAAIEQLRALGARRIAVVVPYPGQSSPSQEKWTSAGFEPTVLVGDPSAVAIPDDRPIGAIVLDYVGHPAAAVAQLREGASAPVVDLGEAGADAAIVAVVALAQRRAEAQLAGR
jgi:protein AroM